MVVVSVDHDTAHEVNSVIWVPTPCTVYWALLVDEQLTSDDEDELDFARAVFAEDRGSLGTFIRGGRPNALEAGARPALPPPARDLSLRDAFQPADEE